MFFRFLSQSKTIAIGCLALAMTTTLAITPAPAQSPSAQVILVVDTSGSMLEEIEGRTKMSLAQDALQNFLKKLGSVELGMRVYSGSRSYPNDNADCVDSRLMVSMADSASAKPMIQGQIANFYPNGRTPLAYSIQQAIQDFRGSAAKKVMIVLTDGLETCNGDPCAAAKEAARQGIEIQVIGFGLDDASDNILQCISTNSGGHYYNADNQGQLEESFKSLTKDADLPADYVKCIDWSQQAIVAVGGGAPPAFGGAAQKRMMAQRAAVADAYRQIAECVYGVHVDAQTTVKDYVTQDDTIRTRVQGLIQGSQIVDTKYMSDGSVEATVKISVQTLSQMLGRPISQQYN